MQYKCDVCHDSGSKNQTGDYLDCPACDMPHTRKALNDFVKSLGPTHPEDVALAIHQRALAMAPKQEAPDGWVLVPVKPTPKMVDSTFNHDISELSHNSRNKHIWAAMIVAAPEPIAAPAAANGALTDEQIDALWNGLSGIDIHNKAAEKGINTAYALRIAFARAILAAAGPDAALIKALKNALASSIIGQGSYGLNYDGNKIAGFVLAALSGAKGN